MAIPSSVMEGSVGLGESNQPADVTRLQRLLNAAPSAKDGPSPVLDVDVRCGPLTCGAIRGFQIANHIGFTDGPIEPGQQTEPALRLTLKPCARS